MSEISTSSRSRRKPLTKFGTVGSIAYLAAIGAYAWANWPEEALELNVLGDFLAGAFAPLAFLWLVLGFLQQGRELSLQIEELRHSVSAQRDLVDATNLLRDHEIEAQNQRLAEEARINTPILVLTYRDTFQHNSALSDETFNITNGGRRCTNLKLNLEMGELLFERNIFDTGDGEDFRIIFDKRFSGEQLIRASFIDARSLPGTAEWTVLVENGQPKGVRQKPTQPLKT